MVDPHRSRKIEYELLRMVVQCQDHLGYHATLGNLALFFRPNIPDIENRELVEALKRLRPKYLALCKYVSGGPSCQEYPTQIDDDEIFFWRGDGFRMRRTPETALRSEELSSLLEQQQRLARFACLERLGLDLVKSDLLEGRFRWVGCTMDQQEEAWEWIRMKEAQATPRVGRDDSKNGPLFIAESRIDELRKLVSPDFDFQKLIRLCEELNSSYESGNYYAMAMLTRGVLDHVPPLFGYTTFAQVANNYGSGGRSFKETMQHLEGAARKISDGHLHMPIRNSETLPTLQQVNCGAQLDALLSEIVRIMK